MPPRCKDYTQSWPRGVDRPRCTPRAGGPEPPLIGCGVSAVQVGRHRTGKAASSVDAAFASTSRGRLCFAHVLPFDSQARVAAGAPSDRDMRIEPRKCTKLGESTGAITEGNYKHGQHASTAPAPKEHVVSPRQGNSSWELVPAPGPVCRAGGCSHGWGDEGRR